MEYDMNHASPEMTLKVTAADRASLDLELDAAVERVRHAAAKEGKGILVTREAPNSFTVEASHDVPFGLTRERQTW
jgi:hypothetical protein